jgi:hypothetical protein
MIGRELPREFFAEGRVADEFLKSIPQTHDAKKRLDRR